MRITLVLGTGRIGRVSEKVTSFVSKKVNEIQDVVLTFVDVAQYSYGRTIPPEEENEITKIWKKIAFESEAFIFVVPEYNHGFPGELKILLDSAFEEYSRKPLLLITLSDGPWGGARMSEHLKPILQNLGLIVMSRVLHTANADKMFENGGPSQDYSMQLENLLRELVEYGNDLNTIRKV